MYKLEKNHNGYAILSLDPGFSNFGIACSAVTNNRFELRANAVLNNPMREMKGDLQKSRIRFVKEIDYWIQSFNCKMIIAERFQARGIRGNSGELVSMMMGILFQKYRKLDIRFITAATWKNDFHRTQDYCLKDLYKVCGTTPHQLDATLIGVYGLQQKFNCKYPYTVQNLISGVESVSRGKLFNRKLKIEDLQ